MAEQTTDDQRLATTDIEAYLKEHEHKEMLRFITCGSVDDGKSTLIGRLLYDSKAIFEDQLAAAQSESRKYGTTGKKIDLALLVDGLQSEREQGITIDVAYRFFSTERRKYIIADTPGHEQYTRNMVTGASTADAAIILVDARKGILTQTRRHSYIVDLLGIRRILVAVNKMDLVGFSKERFDEICETYRREVIERLPSKGRHRLDIYFIPMSALEGDNVVHRSERMPWYEGSALLELLDRLTIDRYEEMQRLPLRFPVQFVNRPDSEFRGFCGTIASGSIRVGDRITVLPSGKSTKVRDIIDAVAVREDARHVTTREAYAPMAVTLTTEEEVDISRGDLIVHSDDLPRVSNNIKVMIVWMDERPMEPGVLYDIKRACTTVSGTIDRINYKVNIDSYEREKVERLHLNDIASCRLVLHRPVAVDRYEENRFTGGFILIDRISNHTVGAGMILDVAAREEERIEVPKRSDYSEAEIALNEYIRTHYPEWGCRKIP